MKCLLQFLHVTTAVLCKKCSDIIDENKVRRKCSSNLNDIGKGVSEGPPEQLSLTVFKPSRFRSGIVQYLHACTLDSWRNIACTACRVKTLVVPIRLETKPSWTIEDISWDFIDIQLIEWEPCPHGRCHMHRKGWSLARFMMHKCPTDFSLTSDLKSREIITSHGMFVRPMLSFGTSKCAPGRKTLGHEGNGNLLANGIFKGSFVHFVFKGAIDIKSAFRKWLIRLLCCKLGWVNNMANKWGGVYISFNWISKKIVAISSIFSVANVYENCMHSSSIPLYNKASTIFVVINLDSLKPQSWKKPTLSSFVACTGCCNSGDKWLRNNS